MTDTESKILDFLRSQPKCPLSGQTISHKLRVSRTAVWKHIRTLRSNGYQITGIPKRGYLFLSAPDRLLPDEIRRHLSPGVIGNKILSYESLDSTNRLALELGSKGYKEGVVVFAEEQTRGRGRLGRTWVSPKGQGLYFSILLRPRLTILEIPKITLMAAVAIATALRLSTRLDIQIRWPNDLLVEGRKVCGILTEMNAESDRILYVVLGIGINVNTKRTALPPGSSSLREETGQSWDRCRMAAALLKSLNTCYGEVNQNRFSKIAKEWEQLSAVTGKQVLAQSTKGNVQGTALGIDEEGALWIRQSTGIQVKLLSGDITRIR